MENSSTMLLKLAWHLSQCFLFSCQAVLHGFKSILVVGRLLLRCSKDISQACSPKSKELLGLLFQRMSNKKNKKTYITLNCFFTFHNAFKVKCRVKAKVYLGFYAYTRVRVQCVWHKFHHQNSMLNIVLCKEPHRNITSSIDNLLHSQKEWRSSVFYSH